MLHISNKTDPDVDTLEGKRNLAPKYSDNREAIRLTQEELNVYKRCSNESFIKAGLPFAVFFDVVRTFMKKKQGEVGPPIDANSPFTKALNMKRGLIFIANIVCGSFLYTPICYQRLKEFHEANEKKRLAERAQGTASFEGTSEQNQPEDFSYPTDLMTNIGEAEGSFSADFSAAKFTLEEDEKPKIPQTTYDDLRSRNREQQGISRVLHQNENSTRLRAPPEPTISSEPPPPPRVKRNKYGDEME